MSAGLITGPLSLAGGAALRDAAANTNENGSFKLALIFYRCTRYDADIADVAAMARAWTQERAPHVAKPALVLDIDETSLSNWEQIYHNDFGYIIGGDCDLNSNRACGQIAWENGHHADPIQPTLNLFNTAKTPAV